ERVVTSSDSWFRPVDIKAGPDGAIYIADWYDRQVTHTRNQEGNIDTSNGRIYRLKKKGAKTGPQHRNPDLSKLSAAGLVNLLGSSNAWVRQTAIQQLHDRALSKNAEGLGPRSPESQNALALASHPLDCFWARAALTTSSQQGIGWYLQSLDPDI